MEPSGTCQLCGAGPMLESGRWASIALDFTRPCNGLRAPRYRGYVNSIGASGTWPKNLRPKSTRPYADGAFYLHYGDRLPRCQGWPSGWPVEDAPVIAGARRHFRRTRIVAGSAAKDGGRNSSVPVSAWIRGATGSGMDYLGGRATAPTPRRAANSRAQFYDQADVLLRHRPGICA